MSKPADIDNPDRPPRSQAPAWECRPGGSGLRHGMAGAMLENVHRPEPGNEGNSFDFPKGWATTALGEVACWGSGGTPSRTNSSFYTGTIPWVKTGELGPRYIFDTEEKINEDAILGSSAKLYPKGSIVIAMYGATIGKTSILGVNASTNQACAVAQPKVSVIDTTFLYYLLRNEKDNFISKGKGGAQPNISQSIIKDHNVLIPPLAEQKQIAARLDALLAQVDTLKTRLDAIPTILKRFRQSVLAAAVSGKLTEGWRGEKCVSIATWAKTKIDNIVSVINGKAFPSKEYQQNGVKLLRPGNLHISGRVVWNSKNTTYIPKYWLKKRSELILNSGDLLMNLTAQSLKDDFLGRVCILNKSEDTLLNQRICSFKSKLGYDIRPYLFVFFRSPQFREYVETLDSGSLIKHLNVNDIKKYTILLPTPEEQTEIVRRVDQLFAFADQIEQRVAEAKKRVDHLTQSILTKAFRGDLTAEWREQNPDLISGENSAQALLERIKAERSSQKTKKISETNVKTAGAIK